MVGAEAEYIELCVLAVCKDRRVDQKRVDMILRVRGRGSWTKERTNVQAGGCLIILE